MSCHTYDVNLVELLMLSAYDILPFNYWTPFITVKKANSFFQDLQLPPHKEEWEKDVRFVNYSYDCEVLKAMRILAFPLATIKWCYCSASLHSKVHNAAPLERAFHSRVYVLLKTKVAILVVNSVKLSAELTFIITFCGHTWLLACELTVPIAWEWIRIHLETNLLQVRERERERGE